MIAIVRNCKSNVNGQCAKLGVKCLEARIFGGVAKGACRIRESAKIAKKTIYKDPDAGSKEPVGLDVTPWRYEDEWLDSRLHVLRQFEEIDKRIKKMRVCPAPGFNYWNC